MASEATSHDNLYVGASVQTAVKILIVGHFGVGKTTLVGNISEITPLRTEELITQASVGIDDLSETPDKTTTTVAMDFGRLTLSETLVLYLFGTPGQERFKQLWEDLSLGALGALVLVDPERLGDSFPILDLVEQYGLPCTVAVNHFDGTRTFSVDEIREALNLPDDVPIVPCDVRDQKSSADALITLVGYLHSRLS
ncbi:ATP/GTP-binding protein [Streptomyces sp. TRM 70361]|uniref:GTP-binding protein n=1 Tax=Streptomyces sp. TRM 70361 TaxID=3116553 RepID=UPI002E7C0A5D|nr:ATP/GTP-binding protein [Streptomyces sp. TRM 70361]MEE1942121.1 ATP/GTP-binding protein [Streptomyces sp. TRM 70361]